MAKTSPEQQFVASHYREEGFKADGLRTYAKYRDLGIAAATNGMVQAHVIRLLPPFRAEVVSKRHYHEVDFQMVYVLKGWMKTELEGQGPMLMKEGSCWIQPPGVKHAVLRRIGLGVVFRRAVAAELASGCLVTLSVPGLSMGEQFLLIYRSRDHLTPLARNLAARLRADATVGASNAARADTAPSAARASEPMVRPPAVRPDHPCTEPGSGCAG